MCGIFGYIGKSFHPKENHALLTNLGIKTEHRGREATGIWGAQGGVDGQIIYHKEPITASKFVEGAMWKSLRRFNPNVLLVHCREPTTGGGVPSINKNNHPHVNDDYTIGLIHNGRVEEYHRYKNEFKSLIKSECDSELLLRVFQTGERVPSERLLEKYPQLDKENFYRLYGIEQIFKKFQKTHMAVAVGERHEGTKRSLWLFRNDKRPLHVIDLRSTMGVIYFCSTMSIWREAVEATPEVKDLIPLNHDVLDFPIHYAYALSFDPEAKNELHTSETTTDPSRIGLQVEGGWKSGWRIRKYKLVINREEGIEEEEILEPQNTRPAQSVRVFTGLDENEVVQGKSVVMSVNGNFPIELPEQTLILPSQDNQSSVIQQPEVDIAQPVVVHTHEPDESTVENKPTHDPDENDTVTSNTFFQETDVETDGFQCNKLYEICEEIRQLASDIYVQSENNIKEGNVTSTSFADLLTNMEQIKADIIGIKYLVDG